MNIKKYFKSFSWIPSLYFAEGLPYILVTTSSVVMYKNLNMTNADIALYTSWLYLPWVIKPLWSPFVELMKTKKWWILITQFILAVSIAGVALSLPADNFVKYSLIFFWLIAFSSATHDIAADGYYMIALDSEEQSFFIGIRSLFYRLAIIAGQGLIVILSGILYSKYFVDDYRMSWKYTMLITSMCYLLFFMYHMIVLKDKKPNESEESPKKSIFVNNLFHVFVEFFKKPYIVISLSFILLFRLGEAQLLKLAAPFMLDDKLNGGLELSNDVYGTIYGVFGVISLILGGILGGAVIAKSNLKYWIFKMALALNIPNFVYLYLASFQPESLTIISSCIVIEQFGYGFGFAAFMMYMINFSDGKYKTAHYAFSTGFMALGMMIPGLFSGYIQEYLGYKLFFGFVIICAIPSLLVIKYILRNNDISDKILLKQ
ncbi:MAG: MFS transporter [Marinifilaceae bacterium]|jgi:PAT family beta-lactamase induction signal transducer AmpG|nr:MFS transporter [Marinifilaceae bacterium]